MTGYVKQGAKWQLKNGKSAVNGKNYDTLNCNCWFTWYETPITNDYLML